MVDTFLCTWILLVLLSSVSLPLSFAFSSSPSFRHTYYFHTTSTLGVGGEGDEHYKYQELEEWLTSRGISCDGCEVSTFSGGLRGLRASRDAPTGTVLLKVPLNACLLTADFDSFEGAAPSWSKTLPNKVQLALQVLQHNDESSSSLFRPFLKSWPNDIPSLPENIPREELLREAQCDILIDETDKHRAWVIEQYEAVKEMVPSDFSSISLRAFTRAVQLAGSRSIRLPGKGSVLVPLFDMANHKPDPTATYKLSDDNDAVESIELVARRQLSAGEEISISYGEYPNRIMAGCYGFVPRDNLHDFERVSVLEILQAAQEAGTLDASEHLLELEESAVALGFDTTNNQLLATGPEDGLWMSLRAALANDEDYEELFEILDAIEMDEADEEDLWEIESDVDVIMRAKIIQAACMILEHRISTQSSLEQDEACLQHDNISSGSRLLVELRTERKRLLRSASQKMVAVLEQPQNARAILSLF